MRTSGILMHLTSLPSPFGVGTMGQAARDFADFLQQAGQSLWQLLPICPTGFGDSPYQSFSAFAGNPYLIDLEDLTRDGLLERADYCHINWGERPQTVDYGRLYQQRGGVLRKACRRVLKREAFHAFCQQNAFWLDDYALFMALKEEQGNAPWFDWPLPLRDRQPLALEQAGARLAEDVAFWKGVQFLFFRQWRALREYLAQRGIAVIGDMPLYVAEDGVDVWAHPEQFQLDADHLPTEVAGCPPDGFSATGQLWGNPLFDWDAMDRDGYSWWIERMKYQCSIYDIVRIDHFRGLDAYYAIPYGAVDAAQGRWRPGPGKKLFQSIEAALGPQPIIAEDLGFLTPSLHQLREDLGIPGMRLLEFAFDSRDQGGSLYLPHNYVQNCVAYIGTHDNEPALGWLGTACSEDAAYAKEYLRLSEDEGLHWGMMRAIWASVADRAIVQMQDVLGLGSESRMNIPSTVGQNWTWRAPPDYLSPGLAQRLFREMRLYGRLPVPNV